LHLFPQKYFPYEKKKVADEMVEMIRDEFKIMLEELDWMDPEVGGDDGLDQR
jgi:predicted metalloendopeptidase